MFLVNYAVDRIPIYGRLYEILRRPHLTQFKVQGLIIYDRLSGIVSPVMLKSKF